MGKHDSDLWDENGETRPPLESELSLKHSLGTGNWDESGSPAESSSNQPTTEVDLDLDTPAAGLNRGNSKFQLPRLNPSPPQPYAGNGITATTPRSSDTERSPRASDSHQPSLTSEKSWNRRVQARSDELRRLFNLPHTEQLMDDFVCALKKKVLLQGRLFVFDSHLCFSSSLFGYHKLKVIPLECVVSVAKKKNVGFPNSIQIEWDAGAGTKQEFFTSFLSREDAYRLIMGLWDSEHHRDAVTEDEDAGSRTEGRQRQDVWSPAGSTGDVSERDDATPTHGGGGQTSPFALDAPAMDGREVSMVLPPRSSIIPGVGVPEFEELPSCEDPAVLAGEFTAATDAAPPLPSHMQHVMTCTLPVTPRGFYRAFLCSSSAFFRDFHLAQGHHSIKLSPWQRHFQVGPVRDLRFVTPLKGWRIGPPEALCHQTQRFKVYSGEHLVFETNQAMADIPYGDHFKVETRWDVTPAPDAPGHCSVDINIAVPFTKNTMWKKFIEKSVTTSSLEAYQMFKELAEGQLADMRELPGDVVPGGEAGAGSTGKGSFGAAFGSMTKLPAAAAALPTAPGHRRMPSLRPSTPEELLPTTAEEWEALMSQVAPKWRGGLRSLRKTQMSNVNGGASSSSPVAQGVGVGGPSVARHRRRASRSSSTDMDQMLRSGTGVGMGAQQSTRLARVPEGVPALDLERSARGGAVQRAKQFIMQRWPTFTLCLLCFMIICLQLTLLWVQFHRMGPARGGPLAAAGDGKAQAAAEKEVAALISQMKGLEKDAAVWRSQLDALMRTASELTDRARQAQRALGR